MRKDYFVKLFAEGDDLILPIPEEIMDDMDWKVGDNLKFTTDSNCIQITKEVNMETVLDNFREFEGQ
jgi:hypothetical protein